MSYGASKPFLDVLAGKPASRRPIWCMRQAGRYLPEYRQVRLEAGSFLELCYSPSLAAEVTLQPLRRYDLDAAIIFADILVLPHAMGNGLSFQEGEGPILEKVRGGEDLRRLKWSERSAQIEAVCQSLANVRVSLPPTVALIGFCGAPWTVASYMLEGRGSDRQTALKIAYNRPQWFRDLMKIMIEASGHYLNAQIAGGAEAVQIFDSWAGDLSGDLFMELSVEPMRQVVGMVREKNPAIPVICFAKGAAMRHRLVAERCGCAAIGVEQETDISDILPLLRDRVVVQGNLDPIVLLSEKNIISREARRIARSVPKDRHIFNLGHGIKQQTDPEALNWMISAVRHTDGD